MSIDRSCVGWWCQNLRGSSKLITQPRYIDSEGFSLGSFLLAVNKKCHDDEKLIELRKRLATYNWRRPGISAVPGQSLSLSLLYLSSSHLIPEQRAFPNSLIFIRPDYTDAPGNSRGFFFGFGSKFRARALWILRKAGRGPSWSCNLWPGEDRRTP